MAVSPKLGVTINLYKRYDPVITWNEKYSSTQVVSMIYTFGKILLLKVLMVYEAFLFRESIL